MTAESPAAPVRPSVADPTPRRGRRLARRCRAGTRVLGASGWAVAPAVVAFVVAVAVPTIAIVVKSLQPNPMAATGTTSGALANYAALLEQSIVRDALWRTLRVSIIASVVSVAVGTAIVIAITVYGKRDAGSWRVLLLVGPMLSGPIVTVLGWVALFSAGSFGYRVVNLFRSVTGVDPGRVVETEAAMTIGLVHFLIPLVVITLYPIVRRIPPELLDASMTLGVPPLRTIRRVVLPQLVPAIQAVSVVVFAMSVSAFVNARFLGGERNLVLSTLVNQLVNTFQPTLAAAASVILVVVGLFLLAVYARLLLRASE